MEDKMIRKKSRVNKKRAGFTLMELLLAMTVMLLFTLVMTSLMNTATTAYKHSINCSNADVFVSNTVNRLRLELSDARNVSMVGAADFSGESPKCLISTGDYTPDYGVVYTDASTGAECLIFVSRADETTPASLYISKYGEVKPLVNTTDGLMLSINSITVSENKKSIVFSQIEAKKDGTKYSSLDEVTVKLK